MPSVEAALRTILTSGSPITPVGTRVYFDVLPQNVVYPAIRLQRITTPRSQFRTLDGRANYAAPRFQIDIYATTRTSTLEIAQTVYQLLEGFRGAPTGLPVGWHIDNISTEDEAGEVEEDVEQGGVQLYRERMDIFIMHSEA